jgi:hypothetical protein
MKRNWMKVTMIMLMGLLVAGPFAGIHHVAAQNAPGVDKALEAATAANNKAATTWQQAMTKMDSMKKMPMTDNEKAMMEEMKMMADTIKSLVEANKQLVEAIKEMRMGSKTK